MTTTFKVLQRKVEIEQNCDQHMKYLWVIIYKTFQMGYHFFIRLTKTVSQLYTVYETGRMDETTFLTEKNARQCLARLPI